MVLLFDLLHNTGHRTYSRYKSAFMDMKRDEVGHYKVPLCCTRRGAQYIEYLITLHGSELIGSKVCLKFCLGETMKKKAQKYGMRGSVKWEELRKR